MIFTKVHKLELTNYRNFSFLDLTPFEKIFCIVGENGTGKTNILEALSYLTPGKGLRASAVSDVTKQGTAFFEINADISASFGKSNFLVSNQTGKKDTFFNGSKISSQELGKLTSAIWLTPQMDGLFLGPASDRRRFLDRITYIFFPDHAKNINKYDYYLSERLKILDLYHNIVEWLAQTEQNLAEVAFKICSNRFVTTQLLNSEIKKVDSTFPKAEVILKSELTNLLDSEFPEQKIADLFSQSRMHDKNSHRSNFGPHRDDLIVNLLPEQMPAQFCSTGQQKAMMISLIMAQVQGIFQKSSQMPILLLDEIFVHLDLNRRTSLSIFLQEIGAQIFLTTTELELEEFLDCPAYHTQPNF